jgi:hypothetical protein
MVIQILFDSFWQLAVMAVMMDGVDDNRKAAALNDTSSAGKNPRQRS